MDRVIEWVNPYVALRYRLELVEEYLAKPRIELKLPSGLNKPGSLQTVRTRVTPKILIEAIRSMPWESRGPVQGAFFLDGMTLARERDAALERAQKAEDDLAYQEQRTRDEHAHWEQTQAEVDELEAKLSQAVRQRPPIATQKEVDELERKLKDATSTQGLISSIQALDEEARKVVLTPFVASGWDIRGSFATRAAEAELARDEAIAARDVTSGRLEDARKQIMETRATLEEVSRQRNAAEREVLRLGEGWKKSKLDHEKTIRERDEARMERQELAERVRVLEGELVIARGITDGACRAVVKAAQERDAAKGKFGGTKSWMDHAVDEVLPRLHETEQKIAEMTSRAVELERERDSYRDALGHLQRADTGVINLLRTTELERDDFARRLQLSVGEVVAAQAERDDLRAKLSSLTLEHDFCREALVNLTKAVVALLKTATELERDTAIRERDEARKKAIDVSTELQLKLAEAVTALEIQRNHALDQCDDALRRLEKEKERAEKAERKCAEFLADCVKCGNTIMEPPAEKTRDPLMAAILKPADPVPTRGVTVGGLNRSAGARLRRRYAVHWRVPVNSVELVEIEPDGVYGERSAVRAPGLPVWTTEGPPPAYWAPPKVTP